MKRWLFASMLAVAASAPAQVGLPPAGGGPQEGTPSVETGSVPLVYTGGDSRASIGIDQHGNTQGELSGVFGNNGDHAIVAQLWWQNGGAGGIQADYNWLLGTTLEQARKDPDSITVAKLSFALDQNAQKDRQANVGFAIERKEFFLNLYLSGKVSGTRDAGTQVVQQQTTQTGTDDLGNFTQTQTDIATTQLESQGYSYTVGVHGGHFSDPLTARFNGGFDYARGNQGAHEARYSIGVDKYIGTRGWSLSGIAEHAETSDAFAGSRSDNRWWFFVRYEFGAGGAFTPADQAGNTAWIQRALRAPVTGHPRDVKTYVRRGKTTTMTTSGPKQYTALRPVARDDAVTIVENSAAATVDVLANDSDPGGHPLSITAVGAAANGAAQLAGDRVAYTPKPGFVGTDEFTYTIGNMTGLTATAQVVVTVTAAASQPPLAGDDTATTAYGTPVTVAVLANDSDPYGYPLTVTGTTQPAHGTARIDADGSVTYSPLPGFSGSDQFSYTVSDGHGGSASARVTITVQPPLPPVAQNDAATTAIATPVTIAVLANDSDPNGFPLTVTTVSSPAHGTAQLNADGSVTYSPQGMFFGTDSFNYAISNGHGGTASATVTVTVLAPTSPLVARDDTATTASGKAVAINVLANDSAPAGLSLTIVKVTQPAHGTAQPGNGAFVTYTPAAAFVGTDVFTYTVSDGLDTATANVTVTVLPSGVPVAQNDSAATAFNTPVTISVLANDTDPSGYALTVTSVTTPAHGSAVINLNNTITYTPQANYFGADAFSYTISNGHGGTGGASVAVTVQAAPNPVAQPDSATTAFNTPAVIAVLANDSDPNALALTVTNVTTPAHGTAQINGDGTVTYTPQANYFGADSFSYSISNGHGGTASAAVSITVQAPAPPVAQADGATVQFNTPATITVLANDSDPNGLALTVTNVTPPLHGTAQIDANGTITYTPATNYVGADSFTYTISDGFNSANASVNVTVQAPQLTAVPDAVSTPFATPVTITVLGNDTYAKSLQLQVTVDSPPSVPTATAVVNADNTITYTPDPEFTGKDTFTYKISDGYNTATATVTVSVQLPPAAVAGSFTVPSSIICGPGGNSCDICLDDHITNPAGLSLTLALGQPKPDATVVPGALSGCQFDALYTSSDTGTNPSTFGMTDSFTYTIKDQYGRVSTGTVSLTLN